MAANTPWGPSTTPIPFSPRWTWPLERDSSLNPAPLTPVGLWWTPDEYFKWFSTNSDGLFYKNKGGYGFLCPGWQPPKEALFSEQLSAPSPESFMSIFFCEHLHLNSVDMRIKLTRARDKLCLMSPDNGGSNSISGELLFLWKKKSFSPVVLSGLLHPSKL